MSNYYRAVKIPIRIIGYETKTLRKNKFKFDFRKIVIFAAVLALIFSQSQLFAAFEAHIINVTARICNYSEIRSMGYWKNHPEVYLPLLPQFLGSPGADEIIDSQSKVNQVFLDYNLSMRNKLRGQLLAMKFNTAYFGVGEYLVESEGKTLNQLVSEADNLLRDGNTPKSVLEEMKNLLEYFNTLERIRYCSALALTPVFTFEPEPVLGVVINEFLPNPEGLDKDEMPGGEWVELYNTSFEEIDAAGWWLYDSQDSHNLEITGSNTDTGDTIIPSFGFLVVYRNGDANFALNNVGGDEVRLYNGEVGSGADLIDSYAYAVDAPEGKSFARIPDGSDNWVDPVPTPGEPNTKEGEEIIFGPAFPEEGEEGYEELTAEPTESAESVESAGTQSNQETEEELTLEESGSASSSESKSLINEENLEIELSTSSEQSLATSTNNELNIEEALISEAVVDDPDNNLTENSNEFPAQEEPAEEELVSENVSVTQENSEVEQPAEAEPAAEEQAVILPDDNSSNTGSEEESGG